MLNADELFDILMRAEAATPGPWTANPKDADGCTRVRLGNSPTGDSVIGLHWATEKDIQFITAARTDVPALATEVYRCQDELMQIARALGLHQHEYTPVVLELILDEIRHREVCRADSAYNLETE